MQLGVGALGWGAVQRDVLEQAEPSPWLVAESGERGFGAVAGCWEISAASLLSSQLLPLKETE